MSKTARKLSQQLQEVDSELISHAVERFSNISTIRLNGREAFENDQFSDLSEGHYKLAISVCSAQALKMGYFNVAMNCSLGCILFVGGRLISRGKLTPGSLSQFAMQAVFVGAGFSGLSTVFSDLISSLDASVRYTANSN